MCPGKTVSYAKADQPGKAGAASEADAGVRLARELVLPPRSTGYVPVQTPFQENMIIRELRQLASWDLRILLNSRSDPTMLST